MPTNGRAEVINRARYNRGVALSASLSHHLVTIVLNYALHQGYLLKMYISLLNFWFIYCSSKNLYFVGQLLLHRLVQQIKLS